MELNYQEHRTFRIMIIILIAVMIAMLIVVMLNRNQINYYIQKNIIKNPEYIDDYFQGCPSSLTIHHYADPRGTPIMSDDDFYIAILNVDNVSYKANVFVNDFLQGELIIVAESTTSVKSDLITDWWRMGFVEEQAQPQEEEQEDSIEEEENTNKELFYVDVAIEGCNETVAGLTPSRTILTVGGGGGGGGDSSSSSSSSPTSRYALDVVKETPYYLPD